MKTDVPQTARATELLSALVSLDSMNPMGTPYERGFPVERPVIELIEQLFAPHGSRVTVRRQPCSPIHESVIISVAGQSDCPTALFESHIDTVPADEWPDRALQPVVTDDRLIGRGACDDKGSLAAMLLAVLEILEEGLTPPRPIELVCAADEEYAQTGIHKYVAESDKSFAYGIFGEPTGLSPVVQHKGTLRWDITVRGRSAHTSRPELGVNAIVGMMDVIAALQTYQNRLQANWHSPFITGPMITVTTIHGGRTRNAIPDECTIAIDFRLLPGMAPSAERETLIEYLDILGYEITHGSLQLMTPALNTDSKHPLCCNVLAICRNVVSEGITIRGEPYGTDAAWVSDLCPAIVLGPGDISCAHAIDEYILLHELYQAVKVYKQIMLHPFEYLQQDSVVAVRVDSASNGEAVVNLSSSKHE